MAKRAKLLTASVTALFATAAVTMTTAGTASAQGGWSITPVLSGLNSPRGVAVDGLGAVYVSEAGAAGAGDFGVTQTGGVGKYVWSHGALTQAWRTPFTSVYASEGGGPPDALGAAGMSAVGRGCFHRGEGRRLGCQVVMIMNVNHQEALDVFHTDIPQIGHLYRLNSATGAATSLSDFGDQSYAWTQQHPTLWEEFQPSPDNPKGGDANPYGVLVTKGAGGMRTFVADAGANTVSEVMRDGTMRVIAYIPNETPPGTRDSTPTCIAQGPDGMLYVGALDLGVNFALGGGQSNVWRVNPDSTDWEHNATIWAHGLTTVTGCTFDSSGNFWAAEMFQPNAAGPPGDVARVPFGNPTQIERIGGGSLPLPGGITTAPDGGVYVTVGAAAGPGQGGLVRVSR